MDQCTIFEKCSAPLCPLDPEIEKRVWYADEPICASRKYGQHRWIRKQRSIQRRHTKSWFEQPIMFKMLYEASRPKKLTDEQKAELTERFRKRIKKAA